VNTCDQKCAALQRAAEATPEYAAITPLFIALFGYIGNRGGEIGITVDAAGIDQGARENGFPLLSPARILVDTPLLTDFFMGIIALLEQQGKAGDDALEAIRRALSAGEIDLQQMIAALLERRRGPLDESAAKLGVPPPLVEYIFEIPLKAALERFSKNLQPEMFPDWQENICPVCGSRPAMAELSGEEGRRVLVCSTCSFLWPFKRLKCPSCGCEDPEKLSYFTAGEGSTRVDTCRACSRYIKTRDSRKGGGDVPLDVEDLLTIHLDLLASKEGFERGK